MRRYVVLVVAMVLVGCGGKTSMTADQLAESKLEGHVVKNVVTDDKEATDYLDAANVELGLVDAAHVIGDPVTYTVYQYADEEGAVAAMDSWRDDVEDGMMGTSPFMTAATNEGKASDLDGVADDNIVIELGEVTQVVARKGAFVIRATGATADGVAAVKSLIEAL